MLRLLKFPSPALLGAMLATSALNIAGYYPEFNIPLVSFLSNVMIGAMLGRQMDRNILAGLRKLLRPMLIQVSGIFVLSLCCGYILYFVGTATGKWSLSLPTALISTAAGGMTEMLAFGMSVDADVSVIAFMQLCRISFFLLAIPCILRFIRKFGRQRGRVRAGGGNRTSSYAKFARRDYIVLVICAVAGGYAGVRLRLPAGAMLAALFACGALSMALNKKYIYNSKLRFVAQIGLGMVIGHRMDADMVSRLSTLIIPVMLVTLIMLAGCIFLAILQCKTSNWDISTCVLCSAPAGLTQIAVFSEEIGADTVTVSLFHTVRVLGIVAIYPSITVLLASP